MYLANVIDEIYERNVQLACFGVLAAGKTTLAKAACNEYKNILLSTLDDVPDIRRSVTFHKEEFFDPVLFPIYYQNPERYAFAYQVSSFVNRLVRHEQQISITPGINVLDQPFQADRWIYGEANKDNMKDEFHVYEKLYNEMGKRIREPEGYIYIRIPHDAVSMLQRRIQARARPDEQHMVEDSTYLEQLITCNEKFHDMNKDRTIVIDATKMRVAGNGEIDHEYLESAITKVGSEIVSRNLFGYRASYMDIANEN